MTDLPIAGKVFNLKRLYDLVSTNGCVQLQVVPVQLFEQKRLDINCVAISSPSQCVT